MRALKPAKLEQQRHELWAPRRCLQCLGAGRRCVVSMGQHGCCLGRGEGVRLIAHLIKSSCILQILPKIKECGVSQSGPLGSLSTCAWLHIHHRKAMLRQLPEQTGLWRLGNISHRCQDRRCQQAPALPPTRLPKTPSLAHATPSGAFCPSVESAQSEIRKGKQHQN